MDNQKFKNIITRINNLPSLPLVVNKILEVADDSRAAANDLANVISKDQSLAAEVLKLVNSAFYGFSGNISTISHAVVILGFHTIKNLAIGISAFGVMKAKGTNLFDRERFWEHSLGCGVCARLIAERIGHDSPEEVFVAGLLHDIGKLILDIYAKEEFEKALNLVERDSIPLLEAEKAVIGITHPIMGEWLVKEWRLPASLYSAIRYHHSPPFAATTLSDSDLKNIVIVYIANILCKMKGIGSGGDNYITPISDKAWQVINSGEDIQETVLLKLENEMEKARVFFGMG